MLIASLSHSAQSHRRIQGPMKGGLTQRDTRPKDLQTYDPNAPSHTVNLSFRQSQQLQNSTHVEDSRAVARDHIGFLTHRGALPGPPRTFRHRGPQGLSHSKRGPVGPSHTGNHMLGGHQHTSDPPQDPHPQGSTRTKPSQSCTTRVCWRWSLGRSLWPGSVSEAFEIYECNRRPTRHCDRREEGQPETPND